MHYLSLSCFELEVTASTLHLVHKAIGTNAGQYEVTDLSLQNQKWLWVQRPDALKGTINAQECDMQTYFQDNMELKWQNVQTNCEYQGIFFLI